MSTYRSGPYTPLHLLYPVNYRLQLSERLAWRHGPERAEQILAGRDPEANADLAAWRNLGRKGAA